jgi:hypothetical protein
MSKATDDTKDIAMALLAIVREEHASDLDDAMARHPAGNGQEEPDWVKNAVEAQPQIDAQMETARIQRAINTDEINQMADRMDAAAAKIERVEALIATWQASPDMRTRAHADRLSEAFDGRPRE